MTIEQIRELHQRRPFQPFQIHLADGRTLTVEHPELFSRSVSGRTINVSRPDDVVETIDLLLVVSINPVRTLPRVDVESVRNGRKITSAIGRIDPRYL